MVDWLIVKLLTIMKPIVGLLLSTVLSVNRKNAKVSQLTS